MHKSRYAAAAKHTKDLLLVLTHCLDEALDCAVLCLGVPNLEAGEEIADLTLFRLGFAKDGSFDQQVAVLQIEL
ncbi:hypothetical protein HPP92_015047 [Vanilla planifolia]|uniref:Uncharacterized protein n=1 Tax=Vanilla planifolia TaxID=51239 RepID=A0A835QMS6_VANPL|nr:hypothetical protein HPP92_015047 [Vanilla planifolia]